MNTTIEVQHLSKRFGDITAVDDLTFGVRPGRVTGFLGRNGSGKTTTMRMMLGLSAPSAGRVTFAGRSYHDLRRPIREVGAAIDAGVFHPSRTARQHLDVMAITAGIHRSRADGVVPRRARPRRRPPGRGLLDGDASTPRPRRPPR